ncbi:MAG: hypothetical protein JSW63_02985 [Ignavibacterium sp.]|nr:MAG: hypothetical protein JSW63_02985 [Ignavibacterium sp.]
MKRSFICHILLIFFVITIKDASSDKNKVAITSNSYFPTNNSKTLIYKSTFGECITTYTQDGELTISLSEADDFEYRQSLNIKEDGIYITEIYQYLKIFLFIKKEAISTYGKPLLRFPLPLLPGTEWKWEGEEYSDDEKYNVKVSGKVLGTEFVTTKAGTFEAIKLETIVESSSETKNKVTEWITDGVGLLKAKIIIDGGGFMGFMRDLLGYGTIEFELEEIKNN